MATDITQKKLLTRELVEERRTVVAILDHARSNKNFSTTHLNYLYTPMDLTSGDLILSSKRSGGIYQIILGDFTGHGIQAAVNVPLVSDIFYTMSRKGKGLESIFKEINTRLHSRLKIGTFLASAGIEVDLEEMILKVYPGGGLPQILLLRQNGQHQNFESTHVPLGICSTSTIVDQLCAPENVKISSGDRIYLFSDGILETSKPNKEQFGAKRVQDFLMEVRDDNKSLDDIYAMLLDFSKQDTFQDDITLVEFTVDF
ncbi:MAG: serine/threonine-protein phosphatase [Bacteriovoracaceae bacterium]|nr:serine/threonine-protein phosphatase [Bacteriovoracaceae bacterium]